MANRDEAAIEAEIQRKGKIARNKIWALEGYALRNRLAGL